MKLHPRYYIYALRLQRSPLPTQLWDFNFKQASHLYVKGKFNKSLRCWFATLPNPILYFSSGFISTVQSQPLRLEIWCLEPLLLVPLFRSTHQVSSDWLEFCHTSELYLQCTFTCVAQILILGTKSKFFIFCAPWTTLNKANLCTWINYPRPISLT